MSVQSGVELACKLLVVVAVAVASGRMKIVFDLCRVVDIVADLCMMEDMVDHCFS